MQINQLSAIASCQVHLLCLEPSQPLSLQMIITPQKKGGKLIDLSSFP
jgi:hypothetical protein